MQAISFMYVRSPGYNAESAKATEIVDERRSIGDTHPIDTYSLMYESCPHLFLVVVFIDF